MNLRMILEKDKELKDNMGLTLKILKSLSATSLNIDKNRQKLVSKLFYIHSYPKEFTNKILDILPEVDKNYAVKKRTIEIKKLHRTIFSEKINKKLQEYFNSEDFREAKTRKNRN